MSSTILFKKKYVGYINEYNYRQEIHYKTIIVGTY